MTLALSSIACIGAYPFDADQLLETQTHFSMAMSLRASLRHHR